MVSYIGGKSRIGKWIKDFIPNNIEMYCEPFSGAFWVFFNMELMKYTNLKEIIYNDINYANANLFNCLRHPIFIDHLMKEECQIKDVNRIGQSSSKIFGEKFAEYQKTAFEIINVYDELHPDYRLAVEYAYVITQTFSGSKSQTSKFVDLKYKYRCKFDSFRDRVRGVGRADNKKYPEHFNKITHVHNLDFEKVIEMYDNEKAYFYCDPPYVLSETISKAGGELYYSNHTFELKDHKRLANCLKNIKGKFSLSYYYFPELEIWFPKDKFHWEQKDFTKPSSSTKTGQKQTVGTELLIMNY